MSARKLCRYVYILEPRVCRRKRCLECFFSVIFVDKVPSSSWLWNSVHFALFLCGFHFSYFLRLCVSFSISFPFAYRNPLQEELEIMGNDDYHKRRERRWRDSRFILGDDSCSICSIVMIRNRRSIFIFTVDILIALEILKSREEIASPNARGRLFNVFILSGNESILSLACKNVEVKPSYEYSMMRDLERRNSHHVYAMHTSASRSNGKFLHVSTFNLSDKL